MDVTIIIRQILQRSRLHESDRPALSLEDSETWTYRDLAENTHRFANGLLSLGVRPGDRVGILLANSLDYWAVYLAIGRVGAIAVRLNWRLTAEELDYAISDSGCTALFVHHRCAESLGFLAERSSAPTVITVNFEQDEPRHDIVAPLSRVVDAADFSDTSEPTIPLPDSDDPCMIMYTSGTTGHPKGAVWTHANTLWFAAMQIMRWGYSADTVAMSTGPLFHVGSMEDHLVPVLVAGGHAVISRSGSFSLDRATQMLEHHRVTHSLVYPFMLHALAAEDGIPRERLRSLQVLTTGGAPTLPWILKAMQAKYPDIRLEQVYGLTEGGGISTVMPAKLLDEHPGSVGTPLPLTEVKIETPAPTEEGTAPAQETAIGEVWVRSPSVSSLYWAKPEESRETFVDGWCRTGDLGRITDDGFLYLTGRSKDMIISGGENIYPAELEAVLSDMPGIAEVAVLGVADPVFQETVCAVVVREETSAITTDDVISYSRGRLAGYKRPRHVVFTEELPRNASGKILKTLLSDQFGHVGKPFAPAPDTE